MPVRFCCVALLAVLTSIAHAAEDDPVKIRLGMIGLDTSHVVAFSKSLNGTDGEDRYPAMQIVAAYPGGSPDIPASRDRVEGFTKQLRDMGIEIVDSIETLLPKVDAILLMSVDGRPHLKQAEEVILAKKPLFIDKPFAGSLADGIKIAELAKKYEVPCFSSSSLRFSPGIQSVRTDEKIGGVKGCIAWSPCTLEEHHPDLFWYGIHGVEILFTVMGPGCVQVTRTHSDGADVVTGLWDDGRIGIFRGIREGKKDYGVFVFGEKQITLGGRYAGYEPLVAEIAKFFQTGNAPVPLTTTLEMLAFMEAADVSKNNNGATVTLKSVMEAAQK